ncbi:hypothetical protein ACX3YG_24670 [Pseudomonas wadenswilerensis]
MDVDGYTIWITGGSLVLVAPRVSELECRNALASLRHAQSLADALMVSRFEQHRRWHRAYRRALGRRGWRVSHSCQSVETAGTRSLLAPTQPLLLWLGSQHRELGDMLELGIDTLACHRAGLEQLSRGALRVVGGITQIVLELGVLRPGSQLSLCSVALETSAAPGTDWLTAPLAGETLRGDLYFQSLMAEPAPELLETVDEGFTCLPPLGQTLH